MASSAPQVLTCRIIFIDIQNMLSKGSNMALQPVCVRTVEVQVYML